MESSPDSALAAMRGASSSSSSLSHSSSSLSSVSSSGPAPRRALPAFLRVCNALLNTLLLLVCSYFVIDLFVPSPLSSLLSRLASSQQQSDSRYPQVLINMQLMYGAEADSDAQQQQQGGDQCQHRCSSSLRSLPPYSSIHRLSAVSSDVFYSDYLHTGRPVIVTDVGRDWPIANISLLQLRGLVGEQEQWTRRAARGRAGPRGLRLWETSRSLSGWSWSPFSARSSETPLLLRNGSSSSGSDSEDDPFYYSWLNTNLSSSLLSRGLYRLPYFLTPQAFMGEWLYVGGLGTGVTPHIDHMCVGKWSYQIAGCKRWELRSSTPLLQPHIRPLSFSVCAGELLSFMPDHVHSTQCLDDACASLNGYIALHWHDNCYLQRLIEAADSSRTAEAAAGLAAQAEAAQAFVTYRSGSTISPLEAPMDYATKCPQHFRSLSRRCAAEAEAQTADVSIVVSAADTEARSIVGQDQAGHGSD